MTRILVVDDDRISSHITSHALATVGYEVRTTNDGWLACQILQRETFDVIVTDEVMSFMNGQELCRQIRRQGIRTPFVMVTCLSDELDHAQLRDELGVIAVLGKPLNPSLLLDVLDKHSDRHVRLLSQ